MESRRKLAVQVSVRACVLSLVVVNAREVERWRSQGKLTTAAPEEVPSICHWTHAVVVTIVAAAVVVVGETRCS